MVKLHTVINHADIMTSIEWRKEILQPRQDTSRVSIVVLCEIQAVFLKF